MGKFNKTVITDKGNNLLAKTLLGGVNLTFTKISVSDFNYPLSTNLKALTVLSSVKNEAAISNVSIIDNANIKVSGVIANTDTEAGYYLLTIGLYADDPDEGEILYSVTTASKADFIPPCSGLNASSVIIDLITFISDVENITLEVNTSAMVTVLMLNEHTSDVIKHPAIYDYVIDTQEKFDAMIADDTWFDAVSVLITCNLTSDGNILIPPNVQIICGSHNITITIESNIAILGIRYLNPVTKDYIIENINLSINSGGITSTILNGFKNCGSLINCNVSIEGTGQAYFFSACARVINCKTEGTANRYVGFYKCNNLQDCSSEGIASTTLAYGFYECNNLVNCYCNVTCESIENINLSLHIATGFYKCTNIANCESTAVGRATIENSNASGIGFKECVLMTNCLSSGYVDGFAGNGYCYADCGYCNNCRKSEDSSPPDAIWDGANIKIDESSCDNDL